MKSSTTLQDVAALAGVSAKTASRVVNGDPAVTEKTAKRVRKAIATLNFVPNPHARSLRTGRDQAIALIIDSISDPFFAALAEGVEEVARNAGLFLIVANAGDSAARERKVVESLLHRSISGLILVPCLLSYETRNSPLGPSGVPVVFVDRPSTDMDVDTVLVDNAESSQRAVAHLIAHGHRRIGFVSTAIDRFTSRERLSGYCAALEAAGLPFNPELVVTSPYKARVELFHLDQLLNGPDPATAIFSADNVSSLRVVTLLHETARTDVAFVGFDDFAVSEALTPPVTVVSQDAILMGRTAAEMLIRRIAGDKSPPNHVVLRTEFVVRGSGEIGPPMHVGTTRTIE
jgi:LacI family transcriptional regulator